MIRRLTTTILVALMAISLPAQGQKPPTPKMKEAEIAKLASALETWTSLDKFDKKAPPAEEAFMKALAEVGSKHEKPASMTEDKSKWKHLLPMVDSWAEIFATAYAGGMKRKPAGRGMPKKAHVERAYKGKPIGFDYTYLLPNKYDLKKAWPLIVSLPPIDVDSNRYLRKVWMDKTLKGLRDDYIILVPTLGKKTRPKKKTKAFTIRGFNSFRVWNVYWPMFEVRRKFNVDPNRIYLDGYGAGGEIALHLAALRAKDYAGVAVRNAKPLKVDVLPNLGTLPVRFHLRKNGALTSPKDAALRKEIEDLAKNNGLDIEMTEYETTKAQSRSKSDPIIEATPKILEQLSPFVRNPYPKKVHFFSNELMFMRGHWFKVTPTEFDAKNSVFPSIQAEVDSENNVIKITQKNVDKVDLYLNDRLVDMNRVVKVMVNGETVVEEKSDRSLDVMLRYRAGNKLDPGVVVTRQITVKVPYPEEEKSPDGGAPEDPDKSGGGDKK